MAFVKPGRRGAQRGAARLRPGNTGPAPAPQPSDETAALCHELSERLTAAENYLSAARLIGARGVQPADPKSVEILDKAHAQLARAGTLIHRLRQALGGPSAEPAAASQPDANADGPAAAADDRTSSASGGSVYRVRFLNQFARGDKLVTACQREIVVPSAETPEAAVETAKKRFAAIEGIDDWRVHAAIVEVEVIEADPATDGRAAPGPDG